MSSGNFMQVTNANHIWNVKLCATLNKQKEICELNALIKNIKILFKRHEYPNVHRSTVYNSQDMEAT